ncbi:Peptidoglycan-binding domain 1 protein [Leptothrix cholodnii SP-6]|uniref:Peptidoglycan-binding domain 1 protein n=2 Tax=Leptothrix cholodnii TaxID=34029 RepID=B1Y6C8_LEPCP|nr:Peptidoglycan-binding domain 1 protein [Leptothrix cholodnii SP-6]
MLKAMYASFFGLQQEPFSIAPDPRYLYMSEHHREALAHLLYGIRGGGGFVLLTGEIGAGKTTVCRCFLEQIPEQCNFAYIFNPKLTVHELLKAVCEEFGVDAPSAGTPGVTVQDYVAPLNRFLLDAHAGGRNSVLVIDEAQNLSVDLLEQLRLLTNLETAERKLLQIVLIGQPELRDMLARPELEQLAQRVIARFHLQPLSESETAQYVLHRLRVAGLGSASPFDRKELQRIHRLSRGVPRRINLLCDRALLGAYAHGQSRVGREVVKKAAREVFDDAAQRAARRAADRGNQFRMLAWGTGMVVLAVAVGLAASAWQSGLLRRVAGAAAPAGASSANGQGAAALAAGAAAAVPEAAGFGAPTLDRLDVAYGWRTEQQALRVLSRGWGELLGGGDVCDEARRKQLICYRSTVSLALVQQLDRPGTLTLVNANNQRGHVLLLGVNDQLALLQTADGRIKVPLLSLAQVWRGEFTTFWRAPPGYLEQSPGSQSTAVAQMLSQQLPVPSGPDGGAASASAEASLRARIHAFQVTQALQPDGLIGPVTMMKLNRALGVDEPRLEVLR